MQILHWFSVVLFLVSFSALSAQEVKPTDPSPKGGLSKETKEAVQKAMDKGVKFLRSTQNKDGHWGDPGITALIVTAFFRCHRKYGPEDGPWIRKPLEYLASCQKKDGGIYNDQLANYNTSVAILAFTAHPDVAKQYAPTIERAKKFLLGLQCDEEEGYAPDKDKYYGGIGYGGDERPDLSNTQYAIEALRAAGLDKDDPALKKALVFLQRCQNRSESNDQVWAGNDGGFVYGPGDSPAGKEKRTDGKVALKSYGSMTYAGIKSYIHANVSKDDPRVQSAYDWIRRNYDLSQNPGAGNQGLFYYYHTFAKTLYLLQDPFLLDHENKSHNWKEDLAKVLLAKQDQNGAWKNPHPRWWEAEPRLVTAYAILALSYCLEE